KADLILMDLSIPKVSGWDLVKELRKLKSYAKVPIVAITAHAMKGDKEKVISIGCDDYLSKPYRPKELLSIIRKYLKENLN
ncbi:MAG: response regulator, partial [Candidatus Omnitrophota bacterium]